MKKNFFLTLMLAVLCTAASWAQFAPVSGTKYALKEVTSGYYLDIQTLGVTEPGQSTNNISLSAKPCIIYFEDVNGKYTMKNVNGTYAQQASSRNWNAVIGSDAYQWTILDSDSDGYYTIARADGKYVKMDNATNGAPLYCDKDSGLEFALVEYSSIIPGVYTLKTATGTYLTQKKHASLDTKATFQTTAENFKIMPSGNLFYFENNDVAGQYLGTTHQWNATFDFSLLQIVDIDVDGFATIVRANAPNLQIGSDDNTNAGTGIFTNINKNEDKISNKWYFEGTYDYPTVGTVNNNKYHFTSDYITYAGACNKIRFTLTESGGKFQNGKNRMSLDEFAIYDADGKKIELTVANVTGNNNKTYAGLFDGVNGNCGGTATWTDGTEDDWFEILLPTGVDLGGAFKFSFVTENTTMNAKKFTINTSYEKPADYTVVINAPQGETVTVEYNGKAINAGDEVAVVGFDKSLVDATNISGYTWSVVVDEDSKTVTIQYTAIEVVENPAAVVALIKRVGGESAAEQFKFVLDPSINSKNEAFVIGGEDGKVLIKGTTISAITTGIGWYLNNYAHINIAWNSLNEKTVSGDKYADLSNIPVPTGTETRTCDAIYRYYLNTCTFGYSMTSWTWKRWQQEIDWMALHGINMPLQLVGMEEVWRKFLTMEEGGKRKYGYTDAEAKAFVAGPAFIAWWAMNNLEGWGGTAPGSKSGYNNLAGAGGVQDDAWYARQKALAKQITDRQRELGMQPVLPGWSGMVPTNFEDKSTYETRGNGGNWAGDFVRPLLLSVRNANYAEIAADYYKCLHEVMGESQYYSMDPFHEGGGAGTMEDYEALYAAMETAKPGSQWVIQQWQWSATQKYSLTAVPAGRLIVLDLFSDGSPAFDGYNGYAPQDAVFCAIPNFGGRSGLMGRLNNVTDNYFKFKGKYASIKGIGTAPEAIEQTPVAYDLIYQLPWMGTKPDVAEWIQNYSIARYGIVNADVQAAWELLRQGPLNYGADGIQGPVEDVWAARPNLNVKAASAWGSTLSNPHPGKPKPENTYTKARQQMLIDATYKLLAQDAAIVGDVYRSNYLYDIVEFGGAVMADYAHYLLKAMGDAGIDDDNFATRRDAFLQIIRDMDTFRGTNLNFRLGKWTQEARAAAQEAIALGATAANADWYEYNNARTILTTWSSPGTNLTDYSYRSWQGLLKDVYLPRWEAYFNANCNANLEYKFFEWNWAHGMTHAVGQTSISSTPLTAGQQGHTDSYTREPEGNTIDEANKMLAKYIIPVTAGEATTYAYRHLTNDLTSKITIIAQSGAAVDLTPYFGDLKNVTVTGDFIDGSATDLKAVAIKSDASDGSHTGTITMTDGTVITFAVVLNPAYNGVYRLALKSYKDDDSQHKLESPADVFIQYNDVVKENGSPDGYKLIATDNYEADYEADKMFTITPMGNGYMLSAQGLYLKQPDLATWNHVAFSDVKGEAGAYLLTAEGEGDEFRIHSVSNGINHLNAYSEFVFGNDSHPKFSTFTVTQVTTYPLTIPDGGMATLCLPFNIVLPEGVEAYDVTSVDVDANGDKAYELNLLATAGETVKAGTPVIMKGNAGDYTLGVTVDNAGVKGALAGSMLRGNFLKQTLAAGSFISKYTFSNNTFNLLSGSVEFPANSVWMELPEVINTPIVMGEIVKPDLLGDLIAALDELIEQVADVNPTGKATALALTTTQGSAFYVSTNADQNAGGNSNDGGGVAALVDNNENTYFHTRWDGAVVDEPHYIQVDLGAENLMDEFKFTYKPRNGSPAPTAMTVYGSNDGVTFTDVLATINSGLPAHNSGSTYESAAIDSKRYRYLRFTVTGSQGPGDNKYGDQYFFGMLEFDIYKFTSSAVVVDKYKVANGITDDEVATAYDKMVDAGNVHQNGTEGEKKSAYDALKPIYDALYEKINNTLFVFPELGKVYRIKNYTEKTPAEYQYHYLANSNASIVFPTTVEDGDKSAMWVCTSADDVNCKYKFVSALGTAAFGWQGVAEEAVEYTVSKGVAPGAVTLTYDDGESRNLSLLTEAHDNRGYAVFDMTTNRELPKMNIAQLDFWSTDWYLEEVEDADVSFTASINKGNMWATMYLPYAVAIPDGVDVYYATGIADDDRTINLTQLEETIPARTAVLLHRTGNAPSTETTVNFEFALADDVEAVDNLFEGKILTTAICVRNKNYIGEPYTDDDYKVYLLVNYNGKEKFYWMADEYDANCVYKGDGSYYVKCDANKAYLKLKNNLTNISSLSFRYDGTTDIEEVKGENGKVKAIYDFQGRKITEITKPGFYIVDGEKVFVK